MGQSGLVLKINVEYLFVHAAVRILTNGRVI
jgi:hypothetical protein